MAGHKMKITNEALCLFLKSLPQDSMFQIISFGTDYDFMINKNGEPLAYNEENLKNSISYVTHNFDSNMGGTNILKPLKHAIVMKTSKDYEKHIFLLTDGETDNSADCIKTVE